MNKKIYLLKDLKRILVKDNSKKKVVLCHGVFDVIHFGHLNHFEQAKKFGDILVVSVTADRFINKGPGRPVFNLKDRLKVLSGLEAIDYLVVSENLTAVNLIKKLRPNIYCKGLEYKSFKNDLTGEIKNEINAVKKIQAKIKYTNLPSFSSSKIINSYGISFNDDQNLFLKNIRNNFSYKKVEGIFEKLSSLKILLIGESIIDEYDFCEGLGKSGKESFLVLREIKSTKSIGGALSVANYLSEFCHNVHLVSYLGDRNNNYNFIKKNLSKNVYFDYIKKVNSPTIIKKRVCDYDDRKKLLGIYTINDDLLNISEEKKIISKIEKSYKNKDAIIVSDYGHGLITKNIAERISKKNKYFSLNAQINAANIGYSGINKYRRSDCLVINAKELRHELREREGDIVNLARILKNKIHCAYLAVTQGRAGVFLLDKNNNIYKCPAFANDVVDKVGAGDALHALLSILIRVGCNYNLALLISSLAAANATAYFGNDQLIKKRNLLKILQHILE